MLLPTDEVNTYSAAVSYNVLEHIEDHVAALRSMARLVRPGGRIVLIVPAFPFAMSPVDIATGHVRRYTKKSMRRALAEAGLTVEQPALRQRARSDRVLPGHQRVPADAEGRADGQALRPARPPGDPRRRTPDAPALRPIRVRGRTRTRIAVTRGLTSRRRAGPGRGGGPGPALEETYNYLSVRRAGRVTRQPPSGAPQPGRRPVPVQSLRRTQCGDHELDRVLHIPGQLEALRRRPAPGRSELPRRRHHGAGQAGEFRGVPRIEWPARPAGSPGRSSQAGDLITQPGPWVGAQGGIPEPGRRLVAREVRMVVRSGEAAGRIREPVEQVSPPQRAIDDGELRRRLAAATRCGASSRISIRAPCSIEASSRLISNQCRMVTADRERARMCCTAPRWVDPGWVNLDGEAQYAAGEQRGQRESRYLEPLLSGCLLGG